MGARPQRKKATSPPAAAPRQATAATNVNHGVPGSKQKPSPKEDRKPWSVPEIAHLFNISAQSAKRKVLCLPDGTTRDGVLRMPRGSRKGRYSYRFLDWGLRKYIREECGMDPEKFFQEVGV